MKIDVKKLSSFLLASICVFIAAISFITSYSVRAVNNKAVDTSPSVKHVLDSPIEYKINFENITAQEYQQIEPYLMAFSGYQSHIPIETGYRYFFIKYQSTLPKAILVNNLNKMSEEINLSIRLSVMQKNITVQKIGNMKIIAPLKYKEWE